MAGAGILVAGRTINQSKDTGHAADGFPGQLNRDEIASVPCHDWPFTSVGSPLFFYQNLAGR
jgi:hypothetical protein